MSESKTNQIQAQNNKDVFRDSYVRFIGYSHEIVDGIRQLVPLPRIALQCAYALTAAYIFADAGSKAGFEDGPKAVASLEALRIANNALLWQFFASIIIPRLAISGLKQVTATLIRSHTKLRWNSVHTVSTLFGLGAIPALSRPIDRMVDVMVPARKNDGIKDLKKNYTMKESGQYDIYRDSAIRYLGYSNEIGEAFRALISSAVVKLSYGVSIGYCLCDTADKANRARNSPGATNSDVALKAGDVLIWQLLASVVIPGFTINRITRGTWILVRKYRIPKGKYIPTLVGLASIPIIIHPIDRMVDYLMDNTYRKYVQ